MHADARAAQAARRRRPSRSRRRACPGSRPWRRRAESTPAMAPSRRAASRHGAAHGARRVLAVRDRDDAGAADQAERGLDAHDAVGVRRGRRWSRRSRCRWPARTGWRRRPPPSPSWIRRGCGRARRGSGTGRRARSIRSTSGWSGCWPTRSGWPCPGARRPPRAAAAPRTNRARGSSPPGPASPAVVVMRSAVSRLSLSSTGMPCSGPRGPFSASLPSRASAMAGASGFVSMTLRSSGPRRSRCCDAVEIGSGQCGRRERALPHPLLEVRDGGFLELERRRGGRCVAAQERSRSSSRRCGAQEIATFDPTPQPRQPWPLPRFRHAGGRSRCMIGAAKGGP